MKFYSILYQFLLLYFVKLVESESYYSIVAPGTMKSNRKYTVAVTLHDADEPCTIRLSIEGPSFTKAEEVSLRPFESKLLDFFPARLERGAYKLIAESLSGFQFRNESRLNIEHNNGPHIYIQTDKAIYRPKDLVQFRVVILDEHTKPLNVPDPIRIEIMDGSDNRVKQFTNITPVKGVYTNKFQLTEQPVLGAWKINVTIGGRYNYSSHDTIQVQKYVLPKFSVFLKAPTDIVADDGYIRAVIFGKYTFDKYVMGNATVELWNQRENEILQQKQLDIDSMAFVEFDLKNIKDLKKEYRVFLKVKLTEKYTGITQEERRDISVRGQRYNIRIPYNEIESRNNKPYRLKAQIEHWTGAEVLDRETPVFMEHGGMKYESYLDENGVATFEFEHQRNAKHIILYKDSRATLPSIFVKENTSLNDSEYYCKLKLIDEKIRLGKPVQIEVSSIETISYLVYTIVGHGSLIRMEHITLEPNQNSYIIQITPTIEMVPYAYVYVHYVHRGNLRYEEMELRFPREFENQISVTAPKQVRPGQEVTINLKAQPKSYVSILAVDLSVCLLDCSYDLYKQPILSDLALDKTYVNLFLTEYPGLISGVLTLTNAHYAISSGAQPSPCGVFPRHHRFRTKFPETWIFENLEITDTNTQLTLNIPDTITAWRITAFTNNEVTGFGIVDGPTDITTIQPFFISLNLPYSVKRGEIVEIPVTLFNYLDEALDTEVIMYNDDGEFYFMESTVNGTQKSQDNLQQIKNVNVPSDEGKTLSIFISPKKLGDINIQISATNSLYSDAVHQKLRVESDGVAKHHNQAMYVSSSDNEILSLSYSVEIPTDCVPNSEYITLTAGGDYMVPAMENLNELIQMPTGCGEQNMINFAPNVLVLEYLTATGNLSEENELVKKIRANMDLGYQQQLCFRHRNGGYSVFGEKSDGEASTWLTAYVVRYFIKALKYYSVEKRIIDMGLDYLAKQQQVNGEFPNTGYLLQPAHKNEYGFTAFVLLTFLEDRKNYLKYEEIIQNALQFINSNLDEINDIYALSIIANALTMAKHKNAIKVLQKLKTYSKTNDIGHIWWSGNDKNRAKDVEITANILMALLNTPGDHSPIFKWLIQQRNAQGGFKSTHDTVVGLQALVRFSEKYNSRGDMNTRISYCAKDKEGNDVQIGKLGVNADNILILQNQELPKSTRSVTLDINGTGNFLMQLSHQYYLLNEEDFKHFLIKPKAKIVNSYELNLEICFIYQSDLESANVTTNMVILEVNLPSGYRSDAETSFDLIDNKLVKRIESKNDESVIILYLDNLLANMNHCLNIAADKTNDVLMCKPAAIKMYDYYNISRSNTEFYNIEM